MNDNSDLLEDIKQSAYIDGYKRGRLEGAEEKTVEAIKSLMKTMNMTAEQAMTALNIPLTEREGYSVRIKTSGGK
ncbi:MAG: hypothetical protein VZR00_05990 [Lachnospiraceae bacterium]|jgi:hypothetical protein|nr:hypothetical protein [Lachnospiraceae bacterium]MEE3461427.1 hypothetical protein [Lachnospiraceae bacterium]